MMLRSHSKSGCISHAIWVIITDTSDHEQDAKE